MGQCFARLQYAYEKTDNMLAWRNWQYHPARKLYEVQSILGTGAFSEVRFLFLARRQRSAHNLFVSARRVCEKPRAEFARHLLTMVLPAAPVAPSYS